MGRFPTSSLADMTLCMDASWKMVSLPASSMISSTCWCWLAIVGLCVCRDVAS